MNAPAAGHLAVLCDDRATMRGAVETLMRRSGFVVAESTDDLRVLLETLAALQADVAVLTLAACGARGLTAVGVLKDLDEDCEVVVLSSFLGLREAAAAHGAHDLVDEDDLRALGKVLVRIAGEPARRRGQPGTGPSPAPTVPATEDGLTGILTTNPSS